MQNYNSNFKLTYSLTVLMSIIFQISISNNLMIFIIARCRFIFAGTALRAATESGDCGGSAAAIPTLSACGAYAPAKIICC
ncbi:MAG: hypothetical protein CVV49_08545 [Spirochaetae bacterium HGW-Spirochaetae-5]|nr:MAG: hypothetical protein CVV49_08545 [Spirochaetae bacterium HGW-Spirochaetae-5]